MLPGLAYGLALAVRPAKYAAFRPRPVLTEEATGEGGRGVGRELLHAAERYARAHGCVALRLEVRYDNARAIALYEKLGYREFSRYPEYYADGATALRFEKSLTRAPERA